MTLTVTDDPPDRPAWVSETIRLLADGTDDWRARLLARVEQATDAELAAGSDDDWGVGQIAAHLLIVERGVTLIALRLAQGQEAGSTGQPRPAASAVTRPGISTLAEKAAGALRRLRSEFPAEHRPPAGPRPGHGHRDLAAYSAPQTETGVSDAERLQEHHRARDLCPRGPRLPAAPRLRRQG